MSNLGCTSLDNLEAIKPMKWIMPSRQRTLPLPCCRGHETWPRGYGCYGNWPRGCPKKYKEWWILWLCVFVKIAFIMYKLIFVQDSQYFQQKHVFQWIFSWKRRYMNVHYFSVALRFHHVIDFSTDCLRFTTSYHKSSSPIPSNASFSVTGTMLLGNACVRVPAAFALNANDDIFS